MGGVGCCLSNKARHLSAAFTDETNFHTGQKRKAGSLGRKAERKADRQIAKQRKAQYFASKPGQSSSHKLDDEPSNSNSRPVKRPKLEQPADGKGGTQRTTNQEHGKSKYNEASKSRGKEKEEKSQASIKKKPKGVSPSAKRRTQLEEEEDAYAAMLEKKLGLDKKKKGKTKYGSGFENDGLLGKQCYRDWDHFYLLTLCD